MRGRNTFNINLSMILLYLLLVKVMSASSDILKNISLLNLLLNVSVIIVGFCLIMRLHYSKHEILFLVVTFCIYFFVSIKTTEMILFVSVFAMLLVKGIKVDEIIQRSYKFKCIFIWVHIVLYFIVMLITPASFEFMYTSSGIPRHTFFMGHANNFSGIVFWVICEYTYLHFHTFNFKNFTGIILLGYCVYHFTVSRTFLISIVLLLILMLMIHSYLFRRIIVFISKYIFIISSIISLLIITEKLSYMDGYNRILNQFDLLFSRRLTLGILSYREYGLSLFPTIVDYTSQVLWDGVYQTNLILDNFYFRCLISYGFIFLLYLSVIFYRCACFFKKNIEVCLFLMLACIIAFSEIYISNAIIAFPLYFVADCFISKEETNAV